MGTYLNPGKHAYVEAVSSVIFVDKTPMIRYLNSLARTRDKYVCVSRPRRFGKTMAVDMLSAYYGRGANSRDLYQQMKLAVGELPSAIATTQPWDTYLGAFDVLRVVMTDFFKEGVSVQDAIDRLQQLVVRDIVREYPDASYFDKNDVAQSMTDAFATTGRQFVVLISDMTTFRSGDDVLSLLVHLGYLGYDDESREVFVPNREILDEFKTSTKTDDWSGTFYEYKASKKLLKATLAQAENGSSTLARGGSRPSGEQESRRAQRLRQLQAP